jgi:transcriptional regulator with XRE-family HTH domain
MVFLFLKAERLSSKEDYTMTRSITYRIKQILKEKNISQKQLSEITGITESAISRYIKGDRVPRGANLVKISKALETTTDDLLKDDCEMDKNSDLIYAKSLIARNASQMTKEEKMEFIALLMDKGVPDEIKR